MLFDAIVIGCSYAGMVAALRLLPARCEVLPIDGRLPNSFPRASEKVRIRRLHHDVGRKRIRCW